jgi:hypothetical protein
MRVSGGWALATGAGAEGGKSIEPVNPAPLSTALIVRTARSRVKMKEERT